MDKTAWEGYHTNNKHIQQYMSFLTTGSWKATRICVNVRGCREKLVIHLSFGMHVPKVACIECLPIAVVNCPLYPVLGTLERLGTLKTLRTF